MGKMRRPRLREALDVGLLEGHGALGGQRRGVRLRQQQPLLQPQQRRRQPGARPPRVRAPQRPEGEQQVPQQLQQRRLLDACTEREGEMRYNLFT